MFLVEAILYKSFTISNGPQRCFPFLYRRFSTTLHNQHVAMELIKGWATGAPRKAGKLRYPLWVMPGKANAVWLLYCQKRSPANH